jgi:L-lactate utilization protein LutB
MNREDELAERLLDVTTTLCDILDMNRIPNSCGACGTPNASCDMDCMLAPMVWTIRRDAVKTLQKFGIALPKGLIE